MSCSGPTGRTAQYQGMKALDITYNRLAKRAGGNIGIMRKKAAVARWNLIHQETLTAAYKKCLQWKTGSENEEGQFSGNITGTMLSPDLFHPKFST